MPPYAFYRDPTSGGDVPVFKPATDRTDNTTSPGAR
jgi:hypothetical protein